MTNLRDNIWAVEVPEGAHAFQLYQAKNSWDHLTWYQGRASFSAIRSVELPPGQWQIVCTSKAATVEQAMAIVNIPLSIAFGRSAHDWLNDLLTSRGLDLNKNYLLLKKIA